MNPHRPRRPRTDGAAIRYLDEWRELVVRAERATRKGERDPRYPTCPCPRCDDRPVSHEARERLEGLMRDGGRRAHRLRVDVQQLDERFRAATVECHSSKTTPWWERREVEWER
jgi:hypothetical protein